MRGSSAHESGIVDAQGRSLRRHHVFNNAFVCVIDTDGRIFGEDKARGRWCFGIATRKVTQVWQTGYATGRFEELVYAGKLDERKFGLSRPDLIGWQGGVPLRRPDGAPVAAAFSGMRGEKDVEIIERAEAVVGLTVVRA
ncbi:MAG TPA: hypothetical protein VGA56_05600 [Opitutaceae bacterium]